MLNIVVKGYTRPCLGVVGGVSRVWVGDPSDFDFTQAAPASGDDQPYTAIARMTGATQIGGGNLFPIEFQEEEGELKFTHSRKGCSVKYMHELTCQLPQLSHDLTTFMQRMDRAGCCVGLLLVIEMNDGKIFIMGEMNVNDVPIRPFRVRMEGTDGTSGKVYDDTNGANVKFTAPYMRGLFEFTGGVAAIVAME